MSLFAWLFLGHMVGDWLLQNDWMAASKTQQLGTAAGMTHHTIYTFSVMIALWLGSEQPYPWWMWLACVWLVFGTHWLIDSTGIVSLWMRFMGQTHKPIVQVMVDQIFHLLVLALIGSVCSLV
ncbi:MAG: DUF3307 domain-containing protein [Okeania sp. SIO3B3]|nr:DUF3307 domain-containing protein [Okeania sp. SIO3B3]